MDIYLLCFSWVSFILIRICNGAIFKLQPSSVPIVEGNDAYFVCFVSEMEDGQYVSWMKDSTPISRDTELLLSKNDYKLTSSTSGDPRQYTLHILSVEREDGLFSYSCNVYNSDGITVDASSDAAKLTVLEIPADYYPHCETTPPGSNYRDGNEVSITCTAELTEPPVSLQLRKNEQVVYGSLTSSPETGTVILIQTFRANKENNGDVFTCNMTSTVIDLQRTCTTSPLVFNYIPIVTIQGPSVMDVDSETIYFCTGKAMPAAREYVWSLSRDVDRSRYTTTDSSQILRITKPGEDLNGLVITCTVHNSIGESSDKITLTSVETSPFTTIQPVSRNASETFLPPRADTSSSTDKWHDNIVTVAIIAGLALVVFILLALLPIVCIKYYQKSAHRYDQARAESETYMFSDPRVRPQPIPLPLPIEEELQEEPPLWTRSIGTQVTEEEVETPTDPIYIEIPPDRHTYSSSSL